MVFLFVLNRLPKTVFLIYYVHVPRQSSVEVRSETGAVDFLNIGLYKETHERLADGN